MEKELKVSELAVFWNVSVPATWNRIRKEGLTTIKKLSENKKEVTYVTISDEILQKYVMNVNNNINNVVNNRYYEDMLINDNINNNVNNVNNNYNNVDNAENTLTAREVFEKLTDINNHYNEELKTINNELIDAKSKMLLLEDRANREGLYINEINDLKKDNNRLKRVLTRLITLFVITLLLVTGFVTYNIAVNLATKKPEAEVTPPPVEEVVPKNLKRVPQNNTGNYKGKYQDQKYSSKQ